ncbi:MAG: hypothetical protein KDK53_15635 [Maritimibacter sp.]|nr:hypothetical protein [Maritimibacter sp.]
MQTAIKKNGFSWRGGALAILLASSLAAAGGLPAEAGNGLLRPLIKANKVIYYCVGWEAGRLISIKKYGRAGDPGVCPKGFWLPR